MVFRGEGERANTYTQKHSIQPPPNMVEAMEEGRERERKQMEIGMTTLETKLIFS